MFDLEKFKTGKYYVHLPTKEIYDDVMEYLEENGIRWIGGDKPTSENRWTRYRNETCIRYGKGLVRGRLDFYKEKGYKQLEINKVVKGDTTMNEKMKRDLIKLLFEKEFSSYDLENMYEYKGRVIIGYFHRNAKFIDFIEMINENYNIKGHEVAEIIIEEFDLEEYKG